MAVKVFLTGITGYIGGSAFYYIYNAHHGEDFEYSLLIRDEARAKLVKDKYPDVKFIYGTLEDSQLVEKAAAEADIVIHTADSADNVAGATAIGKGLKAGHTCENPAYYIHLCGAGILCWNDQNTQREGEAPLPEEEYFDVDGVDRLVNLPAEAWHRNIDELVQSNISDAVRVAIICPPTVYGVGRGECMKRSIQVPALARFILKEGYGPIVGQGKTEWDNVHIDDLGDLFLRLFEAALDQEKKQDPELFGPKAYFLAGTGAHVWSEIAKQMADIAKKPTKNVTQKEVLASEYGNSSWAQNSKGVAQRASKYLGWQPKGVPLEDTLAEVLEVERKTLGL